MAAVRVRWASLRSAHAGLVDLLDTVEQSRLDALDSPADRARFLLGTALLRGVAGEAVGAAPATVALIRACERCDRPHGRPRVAGGPHLSLSHSGVLVVVASCWDAPVGIDVQRAEDTAVGGPAAGDTAVGDLSRWVRDEARRKAGHEGPRAFVVDLDAPLSGYTAALAVGSRRTPYVRQSDGEHLLRT